MKKSLEISDSEKYGTKSPEVALPSSASGKEPEERKSAPTIELYGPQVDAFCACSLKPGQKGTAKVHFVVKSVKLGDEYGSAVPGKDTPQRVTLSLSHVEADDAGEEEGAEEDEEKDDDTPDKESDEQAEDPKEEAAESDDEDGPEEPAVSGKKAVGVKDTGLDNM